MELGGVQMAEEIGSTVPRRQLGRLLRLARTEAGVTLDAAAEELEYSRQKVWRIECGMGSVRALDVKAMCELYGVSPEMTEVMRGLATETKAKGWWHAYGDAVPHWFELYVGLESAATHLRGYDESLITGILQTREYAQAIYRLDRPTDSEEDHERAVEVRMQRQALLTRRLPKAPRVETVLSESVLHRVVGDSALMADQLQHLLKLTELPNLTLRVLPLAAGLRPGAVGGSFIILDFPVEKGHTLPDPSIVYSESLTGALYLDRPDELAAYEKAWEGLVDLALNEEESKHMINKIIGEMGQ